jgi:hypothetical protein
MADNVKIELGLQPKTVQLIKDLTNQTTANTPADTIASSVELVAELLAEIQKGSQLFLKKSDGTTQQIQIQGTIK